MRRKTVDGQVGLLLLVVLGLVIAIVLSIASRSLSDVVLSRQERENSAAFELAEQGVEEALLSIGSGAGAVGGVVEDSTGVISGQYQISEQDSLDFYLKAGEQAEIDLSTYSGTEVELQWTRDGDNEEDVSCSSEGDGNAPASIEIIAIQNNGDVIREYYNGYNCSVLSNGFSNSTLAGSNGFVSRVVYSLPAGANQTRVMRVKPYYSGATLQAVGAGGLPLQMYLIEASAQGGEADKEIKVKRLRDSAGSVFDYALFSGTTIVK